MTATKSCVASLCLLGLLCAPAHGAISVEPAVAKQGQTVSVTVSAPSTAPGAPIIEFNNGTFKSFERPAVSTEQSAESGAHSFRTLIAVPALLKPGKYKISAGNESATITVTDAKFGVQHIRLPKGKDTFAASPGEKEAVDAAKKTISDTQLWQGKFVYPCKARTSAAFGMRRAVNGKLLDDYFHSGIDFAGGLGAPVYAAQRGKVVIARQGWKLHGNTVCIDHGQGVLTFYIHLSKILVHEGQMVVPGEKIGAVGATGRANGPHLHFSVYVNNEAANPGDWFAKGF